MRANLYSQRRLTACCVSTNAAEVRVVASEALIEIELGDRNEQTSVVVPIRLGRICQLLLLSVASTFYTAAAGATHATFQQGDVIAGGLPRTVFEGTPGTIDWFLPDGTLNQRLQQRAEYPWGFAFDRGGNLYAATDFGIRVFSPSGQSIRNFTSFPVSSACSLTFDANGTAYVAAYTANGNIARVDGAGNLTGAFQVQHFAQNVWAVDLAADQCTLFYTDGGSHVYRYDVCNAVQLPDLTATLPIDRVLALRILSDGGVLIASFASGLVYRLNGSGQVIRTYSYPGRLGWFALALDADGRSFWATSADLAFKFDMASGAVVTSFQVSDYDFTAITVVGEPRAAMAANVPATPPVLLMALSLLLMTIGALRLR